MSYYIYSIPMEYGQGFILVVAWTRRQAFEFMSNYNMGGYILTPEDIELSKIKRLGFALRRKSGVVVSDYCKEW